MKTFFKNLLVKILSGQVKRLREKNKFKIVGVVGSIGKTSTKIAIAKVLQSGLRVQYQEGNYNDFVSVPLVIFGHEMPGIWNIFSWAWVLIGNEFQLTTKYPFDVVVLELGTDHPGDINKFRFYLYLDYAVITAITPEHMEFFKTIEEVAIEEGSVSYFSDTVFINKDLTESLPENIDHKKIIFYGKDFGSAYKIENVAKIKNKFDFDVTFEGKKILDLSSPSVSEVQIYSVAIAGIIGSRLGLSNEEIQKGSEMIESFAGRMQELRGIKNSIIIDETNPNESIPKIKKRDSEHTYLQRQMSDITLNRFNKTTTELKGRDHVLRIMKTINKPIIEFKNPKLIQEMIAKQQEKQEVNKPISDFALKYGLSPHFRCLKEECNIIDLLKQKGVAL